ncbi:vasculin-like isoform X2 [Uloborus diversus]|uniref:vasculin-like isoform X2 n=1 Tax=Uloborus diversus TaxID=327109 RepID=UPI00240A7D6B|nr:vasculin-like isoform X2 [Uloborus diversus]
MANKTPPAHDFAPAWLKIPTYNNFKPSGACSERGGHTSRRDEHSFGFTRHNKESDSLASYQFFNDCRKERDDFDDPHPAINNVHYYGMDNGFNGSCNNQALLSRRPHSRHDFRISLSYAKGETQNKHMTANSILYGHKSKGKLHENNGVSNNVISDGRGIGVTSNNFNQEFPSLQGDISEEPTTPPPSLNGSAWEKPRNIKIHNAGIGKKIQLVKKPVKGENSCESSRKSPASSSSGPLTKPSSSISSISSSHTVIVTPVAKGGSSTCRALTPAKSTLIKKQVREGVKVINKKSSITPPPSTHSMEILVKHPKAPGNKSEFLKALRNEKKELDENEREFSEKNNSPNKDDISIMSNSEDHPVNGIDISKLSFNDEKEKSFLSSSLEAEERLLREMGWKEEVSDDENYAPLTEDELREFRDREQIIKKNGIRRNLLANLSPLRLAPPFPGVPPPTENISSSSDSDSDY